MEQNRLEIARQILDGGIETHAHGDDVASWPEDQRAELIATLLPDPAGRRWLRSVLRDALDPDASAELASRLVTFTADFDASRRDSTTARVVEALPLNDLLDSSGFFAGSNAAGPFWERIERESSASLLLTGIDVLNSGDPIARETTLHILLLDPHSNVRLTGSDRIRLLTIALDDAEAEVRGLAADALADDAPELLVPRSEGLRLDPSEQARMAAWDAAFTLDFEAARDDAVRLALDDSAPVEPRRTALAALSAILSTVEIAPLLEALVSHPNSVLAEDAVNILWTYHRTPSVATAAAQSPHESVRSVAERLLHPETGSPAAGGSRAGAPDIGRDIYQEMLRGYEKRGDIDDKR